MLMGKNRFLCASSVLGLCLVAPAAAQAIDGQAAEAQPAATNSTSAAVAREADRVDPSTSKRGAVQEGGIEDIIVTAQKRSQSLNAVPISITAASGEQLIQQGISSTADLARIVPGLTAQPTPYSVPVYTLRGVGFYESSLSASPTVAVYTDEVPLPFSAMTKAAALDVQRVEVLKGPQGTLFGNNTTGGAINYIANKPTDTFEAGIVASYGRFNTVDLQGFVSGPLASNVNARLSVRAVNSGDWQYSTSRPGDGLGKQKQYQGRFLVDFQPNDQLKVTLNLNGWIDKSDTQAAQLSKIVIAVPGSSKIPLIQAQALAPRNARAADWTSVSGFGPQRRDDYFVQGALRADYELSDALTLTSITSLERYKASSNNEFDGTPLRISDVLARGHINTFSQELRASGTSGGLTYVLGANYERDKTLDLQDFQFGDATASTVGPEEISQTGNFSRQNVTTKAVFGNVEYEIVPNLTIQGGARYTEVKRSFSGCGGDVNIPGNTFLAFNFLQSILRTDGGFEPIGPNSCYTFRPGFIPYNLEPVRGQLNENNVSWRGGVSYKTPNRGLVYATISKGYKAGSFPTLPGTQDIQYLPVRQESILAYEVGFKQPVLDNKVQLIGAAFYYDYKGKQLRGRLIDIVFGPLDTLVQIPKSRVWGLEGQIIAQPVKGLNFSIAGTYVNTKVKEFTGFNAGGNLQNYAGSRFPYAPKLQIVADTQYDFDLSSNFGGFVGASLNHNGSTNASVGYPGDYTIPAYTLLDLRAGVKAPDDSWNLQVWGRNVTDKYYWSNVVLFNDTLVKYAARPATYGVTFGYKF